uniref:Uncharacterized protein n=1 Tax=Anguilla anguilla TaxID=7936 RepID=A0A0E9TRJ9_ANGAN
MLHTLSWLCCAANAFSMSSSNAIMHIFSCALLCSGSCGCSTCSLQISHMSPWR